MVSSLPPSHPDPMLGLSREVQLQLWRCIHVPRPRLPAHPQRGSDLAGGHLMIPPKFSASQFWWGKVRGAFRRPFLGSGVWRKKQRVILGAENICKTFQLLLRQRGLAFYCRSGKTGRVVVDFPLLVPKQRTKLDEIARVRRAPGSIASVPRTKVGAEEGEQGGGWIAPPGHLVWRKEGRMC